MKLWKNFAFAIVLVALTVSCRSYRQAPEDTIKVLAVTSQGDTIQLDVNSLRPRVYQNIYYNYPYYYNYWRPSPFYFGSNYYYQGSVVRPYYRPNSSSGSGPNTSSPNVSTPRPTKPIVKPPSNTNIKNKSKRKNGN
jgi:hypothetical protein